MKGNGQALVELALVMPLLVMLMVGVVELGRLMEAKQRLVYGTALALRVYAFGVQQGDAEPTFRAAAAINDYFGQNLCPADAERGTICEWWSPLETQPWGGRPKTLKLGYTQVLNIPFWGSVSFPLTAEATTGIYWRQYR